MKLSSLVLKCGHGYTTEITLEAENRATVSPGVEGRCPLTRSGGTCPLLLSMGSLGLIDQNGQEQEHYALSVTDGRQNGNY